MIELKTPCEGWFSLSAFKVDDSGQEISGSRREVAQPFRNLITDGGLDRMGNNADWLTWCQVGSGSTAPAVGNSALVSRVAASNSIVGDSLNSQSSPPYYVSRTNTYRFAAGVAAGNLAEVGIGWASTGGLFSRALILDALGSPTTITVLAGELLDVTYQFRQYMPSADWIGSLTLRGVSHSIVGRASGVTSGDWSINTTGQTAGRVDFRPRVYSGDIGPITGSPSGTSVLSNLGSSPYSSGSLAREATLLLGNPDANFAGGIGAFKINMGIGSYQFGFTPKIMKTSVDTLSLTFRHSWSRKTL